MIEWKTTVHLLIVPICESCSLNFFHDFYVDTTWLIPVRRFHVNFIVSMVRAVHHEMKVPFNVASRDLKVACISLKFVFVIGHDSCYEGWLWLYAVELNVVFKDLDNFLVHLHFID